MSTGPLDLFNLAIMNAVIARVIVILTIAAIEIVKLRSVIVTVQYERSLA